MTSANHEKHFEELMAWRDGELQPLDAERVRAHVADCEECRHMEAEMRHVSERLSSWQLPAAPASLTAGRPRGWGMRGQWMPLAAMLVLVFGSVAVWQFAKSQAPERRPPALAAADPSAQLPYAEALKVEPPAPGRSMAQAPRSTVVGGPGPLLVRTARLSLVPRDFDTARSEMERIVAAVGGFTGRIIVSDAQRGARALTATLRVPTAKLDETLTALKALGHVTSESQDGEDVTQQSIDLDARLSNARASEARLKDILDKRTGRLSDVLEVERELSRVRGEIEGMEAQRKSLDRRITYADLTIEMQEERKAAVDLGPLPLATRFRNAFVDGWTALFGNLVALGLIVVELLPTLVALALVVGPGVWMVRRRRTRPA